MRENPPTADQWLCQLCSLSVFFVFIGVSTKVTTRFKTAAEGDNVLIACRLNETASTGIYWRKNDTASAFRQNGTLLTFLNISRTSTGLYMCYSYNKTSSSATQLGATIVDKVAIDVLCKYSVIYVLCSNFMRVTYWHYRLDVLDCQQIRHIR